MPIEAVGGNVELAIVVPADAEVLQIEARILHFRERLDPIDAPTHARPKTRRIPHRLLIKTLIIGLTQMGECGEVFGYFVDCHGESYAFLSDIMFLGRCA